MEFFVFDVWLVTAQVEVFSENTGSRLRKAAAAAAAALRQNMS
jgi:hypothetical protein